MSGTRMEWKWRVSGPGKYWQRHDEQQLELVVTFEITLFNVLFGDATADGVVIHSCQVNICRFDQWKWRHIPWMEIPAIQKAIKNDVADIWTVVKFCPKNGLP